MTSEKQAVEPMVGLSGDGEKFLIVGLGNPGREHQRQRHNIGFMAIDRLAESHGIRINRAQNKALVGNGRIAGRSVILAKPQTYMNNSGAAVGPLAHYYKILPDNVLVLYDELDIPFGAIRLREQGGSGGHNGMKSVIQYVGRDFPRLRLGVGRPPGHLPPPAYLLQDFDKDELPVVAELLDEAVKAVETYLREGINIAMTRHNRRLDGEE